MASSRSVSGAHRRNLAVSIITRVAVSLALLGIAVTVAWVLFLTREVPARTDLAERVTHVRVMEARPVPVRRQWEGYGTARAMDAASVPAQVRGVVVEVPPGIVAGMAVQKGEVLARLDDADIRQEVEITSERIAEVHAQLAQLEVEHETWRARVDLFREEVALAEDDLERLLQARAGGAAQQREVDQARQALMAAKRNEIAAVEQVDRIEPRRSQLRASLAQQQSALRLALRNLERTVIVSPLDGVLQSVDVEDGESVSVDQRIARVVSLRRVEVPLRIPASARQALAVGAEVMLFPGAGGAASPGALPWISAAVARIAPEDDPASRTTTVYVELIQDPLFVHAGRRGIAPGQFVRGVVSAPEPELRWIVPRRSIQGAPGGRIRLIENGLAVSADAVVEFQVRGTFPELGVPDTLWAVLRDPLKTGAMVIVESSRLLPEGTRVEPAPVDAPPRATEGHEGVEEEEEVGKGVKAGDWWHGHSALANPGGSCGPNARTALLSEARSGPDTTACARRAAISAARIVAGGTPALLSSWPAVARRGAPVRGSP